MIPTQREREADFVLVCPGAEAKFSLKMLPMGKARVQALQPAGKGAAKGQNSCRGYRSAEQLPAPPLIMLDVYPCWACPHGSQRETNTFNICCAKRSSTCMFLPKAPAPGVRDQLGACCAKTSKTKIRSLLSWSPTELCLGILLLSPFPQGRAPGKASRVVSGVPLHCCTAGSSEKGWQIPESLGAALTGLSHPLLQDVLQNPNPFTTHCFAEGGERIFTRPLSWYSAFITSLVLSVGQAGGGGTWE